jgi:hypothetical protein
MGLEFSNEYSSQHVWRKPAAYFDTCLTYSAGPELRDCLLGWMAEPADQKPVCPG